MIKKILTTTAFACAAAATCLFAQVGRVTCEWLNSNGDAQRTSWIRTDPGISVDTMSKPGFEQQWTMKLDNVARGGSDILPGGSAKGVQLFVPAEIAPG